MTRTFLHRIIALVVGLQCLCAYAVRTTVDKTLAIIYHPEGTKLILQSDLRPDLMEQVPTLRDAILRELIVLDAQKYKISVTEAEIERHLARIQESLKKTREDLKAFFKEKGYTFEQAKDELSRGLLIETTISERVRSKAIVLESERKKYYDDNPIVNYTIKQAYIPFGIGSKAIMRATVDRAIESGEILQSAQWHAPMLLPESTLAPENAFIKDLQPGAVAKLKETEEEIFLVQLVSKETVPYETRKQEITQELGMKRHKKAQDDYLEGLLAQAKIRYLQP